MNTSAAPIPRRLKADNIIRLFAKQIEMRRKCHPAGPITIVLGEKAADAIVEAAKELGE